MSEELCVICGEGVASETTDVTCDVFMKCDKCGSEYYSFDMMKEYEKEKTFQTINKFLNFVESDTQGGCSELKDLLRKYLD